MSDRSAKLLLEVARNLRPAADRGAFRKMAGFAEVGISRGLAAEVLEWSRGYEKRLAGVAARREGERLAEAKAASAREEMRDEEALARVRELASRKDADDLACAMAAEALALLGGPAE